jgi:hypothetical protein
MNEYLKYSTSLLNGDIMDTTDLQLRKLLKNWVGKHQPPVNGRARLLERAASPRPNVEKPISLPFVTLPNEMFSWATVYSMERGVVALRLVS